jgi:hypothetical protein
MRRDATLKHDLRTEYRHIRPKRRVYAEFRATLPRGIIFRLQPRRLLVTRATPA